LLKEKQIHDTLYQLNRSNITTTESSEPSITAVFYRQNLIWCC